MCKEKLTRFIYMGDPQCSRISERPNDYSEFGSLLAKARKVAYGESGGNLCGAKSDELVVLGGDLVNRGNMSAEWNAFFEAVDKSGVGRRCRLRMASPTGNHSRGAGYDGNPGYCKYFELPGNGPYGYEHNFFSFDYGCAHFIVFDTNFMGTRRREAYKYIGYWIKADLAVNKKPAVFAVMHHPFFYVGPGLDDKLHAQAMQDNYMKLFLKYGVDFILCGHQHVYCRSRQTGAPEDRKEEYFQDGITQVMGVSGTKYFGINDGTNMETVAEFVSVATVFETDGETISLKTIDKEGRILDDYEQRVRIPKPKNCTDCAHFAVCGGTGKTEQEEAEAKARSLGRGALAVQYNGGLTVKTSETVKFSDEDLATLGLFDVEFSVRRKNKLFHERKHGFELRKLLEKAGFDVNAALNDGNADYILNFTAEDGLETVVRLRDIIDKNCYDECIDRIGKNYDTSDKNKKDADKGDVIYELRGTVPAMIYEDFDSFEDVGGPDVFKSNYRLVYGQKNPYDYNGRRWAHHIAEISVIDLNHFKHD